MYFTPTSPGVYLPCVHVVQPSCVQTTQTFNFTCKRGTVTSPRRPAGPPARARVSRVLNGRAARAAGRTAGGARLAVPSFESLLQRNGAPTT